MSARVAVRIVSGVVSVGRAAPIDTPVILCTEPTVRMEGLAIGGLTPPPDGDIAEQR
jgi:hypothetical protein